MNNKIKLMTIVGTRPEIIRLSEIMKKCDKYFNHVVVNTMQNPDVQMNEVFFHDFGLNVPKYSISIRNENPGTAIGDIISETYKIMIKEKPDALLILGDTNSALSSISAKRLRIPIFHMEAGNRSYDLNLPEEVNRKIIDEISDLNMPYTERARMNLIEEGKKSEFIIKTGSPLFEVIKSNSLHFKNTTILDKFGLEENEYFIISIHRNENISDHCKLVKLFSNIEICSNYFNKKVIVSMHPKTKNIIDRNGISIPKQFIISEPFNFFNYIVLQINAFCVISDSGSLAEESNILNFPCVSLRNSTERQEAVEMGGFILGNLDSNSLLNAVTITINKTNSNKVDDYWVECVSDTVISIIHSYCKKLTLKYSN